MEARLLGLKLLRLDARVVAAPPMTEARGVTVVPPETGRVATARADAPSLRRAMLLLDRNARQLDALSLGR